MNCAHLWKPSISSLEVWFSFLGHREQIWSLTFRPLQSVMHCMWERASCFSMLLLPHHSHSCISTNLKCLSLCLPLCYLSNSFLLSPLHLNARSPFLPFSLHFRPPIYSKLFLSFSSLLYSDSPCLLYFPPHQSNVPIFSLFLSHVFNLSLCLDPPLSLSLTVTQRWLCKPCDHFLPINPGGLTALPELTVE